MQWLYCAFEFWIKQYEFAGRTLGKVLEEQTVVAKMLRGTNFYIPLSVYYIFK